MTTVSELRIWVTRRPVAAWVAVTVLAGFFLRSLQYFGGVSFFIDEASLAVNIVDRGVVDLLFKPLELDQTAPPLFLLLAKSSGALFGYSELALRLPAFLSSLLALVLFAFFAKRVQHRVGLCVAIALFALSPALAFYGADLKQYSGDVLAVLLMFFVTLNVAESEFDARQTRIAVLCGIVVVWFSAESVLAAPACCAALLIARPQRMKNPRFWFVALTWAVAAALATIWARTNLTPHTVRYFNRGWRWDFLDFPPRSFAELVVPARIVRGLLWNQLNLWWVATPALALAAFGAVVYWRERRRELPVFLLGPIIVAQALSYAQLYPFTGRLLLFTLPGLVLLLANGIDSITSSVRGWLASATRNQRLSHVGYAWVLIPVAFVVPPVVRAVVDGPPWYNEQMRDVLADIQSRQPRVDKFYVFHLAVPAMRYYAPRFGIPRSAWVAGERHRDSVAHYVSDIRLLQKTSRLWIIFSHDDVLPDLRAGITKAFDSIGTRLDSVAYPEHPRGSGSKAYLYDTIPSRPVRESLR